jgi:hypothetical protein
LPVASHSSAIACCVALEQRLGRAKFFAACMVGQIRCFGVNATSPRARESGSSCGHLIQAYLLVSSMAQAATLSMYLSSWIHPVLNPSNLVNCQRCGALLRPNGFIA